MLRFVCIATLVSKLVMDFVHHCLVTLGNPVMPLHTTWALYGFLGLLNNEKPQSIDSKCISLVSGYFMSEGINRLPSLLTGKH